MIEGESSVSKPREKPLASGERGHNRKNPFNRGKSVSFLDVASFAIMESENGGMTPGSPLELGPIKSSAPSYQTLPPSLTTIIPECNSPQNLERLLNMDPKRSSSLEAGAPPKTFLQQSHCESNPATILGGKKSIGGCFENFFVTFNRLTSNSF